MADFVKGIIVAVAVAAAIVLSFYAGRRTAELEPVTVTDTLVVERVRIDTFVTPAPKPKTLRHTDTLYLPTPDDTTAIDIEQQYYADSTYEAWITSPKIDTLTARLDSIRTYSKTITKTVTIENTRTVEVPKKWGIGIQAGYGVSVQNGMVVGFPYIGVGAQYNILSF